LTGSNPIFLRLLSEIERKKSYTAPCYLVLNLLELIFLPGIVIFREYRHITGDCYNLSKIKGDCYTFGNGDVDMKGSTEREMSMESVCRHASTVNQI
jgi:hypothetical protein